MCHGWQIWKPQRPQEKPKSRKVQDCKNRIYFEESLSELKGTNQTQDNGTSACCIIAEQAMEIRVRSREKTAELFRPGVRKGWQSIARCKHHSEVTENGGRKSWSITAPDKLTIRGGNWKREREEKKGTLKSLPPENAWHWKTELMMWYENTQTQRNTTIWNAHKVQPFSGVYIQQWLIQIREQQIPVAQHSSTGKSSQQQGGVMHRIQSTRLACKIWHTQMGPNWEWVEAV